MAHQMVCRSRPYGIFLYGYKSRNDFATKNVRRDSESLEPGFVGVDDTH